MENDYKISKEDATTLKQLAETVAVIAATDKMKDKRQLWQRHNALDPVRPLIFCDPENGWNEIITQSDLQCKGELARQWEFVLRKEIFWGEEMGDDKPVEAIFEIPFMASQDHWGLEYSFHRKENTDTGSMIWDSPITDYDKDLPKMHAPVFDVYMDKTMQLKALAKEIFEPFLEVRVIGRWWWSLGVTMLAVFFRGMTNIYMDMIDQPDNLKALLKILSDGHMAKLDRLESEGLLTLNNACSYVGSGGWGYTDQLPADDFDGKVRCSDMWGFSESQETVNVSPQMYEEFIFPYEKPLLDRFGLNCYGCCEPIDTRWNVVKKHPRIRRVSCSPWTNHEIMAGHLGRDYIYSMKAPPSTIATAVVDWNAVRKQLRRDLDITKGCVLEVIMKDNHTLGGKASNAIDWCKMARQEIER